MSAIVVAKDFGYVLLAAGAIALQCYLTGAGVGSARKKYKVDYPDTGCGRYSTKLSDKEWVEFNSVMRAHLNYTEQVASVLTFLTIGGLFNPTVQSTLAVSYMVGRQLYTYGYSKNGPKGRLPGAIVTSLSFLGMIGMAFHGTFKLLEFY